MNRQVRFSHQADVATTSLKRRGDRRGDLGECAVQGSGVCLTLTGGQPSGRHLESRRVCPWRITGPDPYRLTGGCTGGGRPAIIGPPSPRTPPGGRPSLEPEGPTMIPRSSLVRARLLVAVSLPALAAAGVAFAQRPLTS